VERKTDGRSNEWIFPVAKKKCARGGQNKKGRRRRPSRPRNNRGVNSGEQSIRTRNALSKEVLLREENRPGARVSEWKKKSCSGLLILSMRSLYPENRKG